MCILAPQGRVAAQRLLLCRWETWPSSAPDRPLSRPPSPFTFTRPVGGPHGRAGVLAALTPCCSPQALRPGHRLLLALLPDDVPGRPVLRAAPGGLPVHHPHRRYLAGERVWGRSACLWVRTEACEPAARRAPRGPVPGILPPRAWTWGQRGLGLGCGTLCRLDLVLAVVTPFLSLGLSAGAGL